MKSVYQLMWRPRRFACSWRTALCSSCQYGSEFLDQRQRAVGLICLSVDSPEWRGHQGLDICVSADVCLAAKEICMRLEDSAVVFLSLRGLGVRG